MRHHTSFPTPVNSTMAEDEERVRCFEKRLLQSTYLSWFSNTPHTASESIRMQFDSNSDFPSHNLPKEQWHIVARPPIPFEEAKFISCACITTRILVNMNNALATGLGNDYLTDAGLQQNFVTLHGMNYLVQTARGVLIKTPSPMQQGQGGSNWSYSSDSSVDSSQGANETNTAPQASAEVIADGLQSIERAYWLRRTLRTAIYGKVRFGIVLQRINPPVQLILPRVGATSPTDFVSVYVDWEAIAETVAIKEMNWDQIQTQRQKLAEDPVKVRSVQCFALRLFLAITHSKSSYLACFFHAGNRKWSYSLSVYSFISAIPLNLFLLGCNATFRPLA